MEWGWLLRLSLYLKTPCNRKISIIKMIFVHNIDIDSIKRSIYMNIDYHMLYRGELKYMKSFRVKNIKSFKDSGIIEFRPITIFVGKNSCGKSSLLRFPVVLAQTALSNTDSPIMLYGKMIDYGNYEDVVFGRQEGKIQFEIHYDIDIHNVQDSRYNMFDFLEMEDENAEDKHSEIRDVSLKVSLDRKDKRMHVDFVELCIDDECLSGFYSEEDRYRIELNYIYHDFELILEKYVMYANEIHFETFYPFYDMREVFSAIVGLVVNEDGKPVDMEKGQEVFNKLYNMANPFGEEDLSETEIKIRRIKDGLEYASTIMSHIYQNTQVESRLITYIGPFRENPERVYRDSESQSLNVGVRGENVSTLLIRDFQKKNHLIDEISEWLYRTMGYKLCINDMGSSLFQIMLENDKGIKSNILDVGFGISQVLPIITQVIRMSLVSRKLRGGEGIDETLYIEQPELHLHPAAQAELADIFVKCVMENSGKTLVIETHSEHLIRKLQVLIADKNSSFTEKDICIYYVDKNDDGIANVKEMKLLANGKFKEKWPAGFFDKAHELSMELLRNSANN